MDRRETLKSLLLGSVAGGLLVQGCKQPETGAAVNSSSALPTEGANGYTKEELIRDQQLMEASFLTEHELGTIAILCDIILPADETSGSAGDAGVPDFIDFIVKDMPRHQLPIRGGLRWLDYESKSRFSKSFAACSSTQQIEIVEDIAYPDEAKPEHTQGAAFFSLMRDLTMTGFYTTRMGIDDLGYKGNVANTWDGVPPEVLAKQDVDYEESWLAKCIDQSMRGTKPVWDDAGNLIG